jgi:putative NIF3 family GTP cyclohydrolase 1 type 2
MIPVDKIVGELDRLFSIRLLAKDPITRWVTQVYQDIGYDHTRVFEADFCQRGNGLMLRAGESIQEVYCAAFPTPDVLENLLSKTHGETLLFLHHPIDMQTSGEGFLPIPPETIARLKAAHVSVFSCHAPMDCHDKIGTNVSIAEAFGIQIESSFSPYGNGFAARFGSMAPLTLDELVAKGKRIFGVDRVEVGGAKPVTITKIAIVAGGGDDLEDLREAERLGAQAYITGDWHPRLQPTRPSDRQWAESRNAERQAFAGQTKIALLGFSHAASEFLVMKTQLTPYFRQHGLPVTCLEQPDWWR